MTILVSHQTVPPTFCNKIVPMIISIIFLTLLRPGGFGDFRKKKHLNARGFAQELLRFGRFYRLSEGLKKRSKSSRLHWKKNFLRGGVRVFCEWHHKWKIFRPPWPTLPGPGHQPLGGSISLKFGSISLKFLLETRLQSESFDTLGNLLGFRVQKLWCKFVKILD